MTAAPPGLRSYLLYLAALCLPARAGFLLMAPTSAGVTLSEHSGSLSGTWGDTPPALAPGRAPGRSRTHQQFLCWGQKQPACDERSSFVVFFFPCQESEVYLTTVINGSKHIKGCHFKKRLFGCGINAR